MATKKSSAKKTSTKKMSSTKKTSKKASTAGEIKAQAGKSAKGKEFDPALESMAALAATVVELNEPRPSTSRYPIPDEKFRTLKEAAAKKVIAKGDATIAKDKGNKVELAGGARHARDCDGARDHKFTERNHRHRRSIHLPDYRGQQSIHVQRRRPSHREPGKKETS